MSHMVVDARRNIVAYAADLALGMAGFSFIPAAIVLVGLADRLTDNKALLGIVAMTGSVAGFPSQIVAARAVHGKKRQKPYMVIPSLIGRNSFLLMAIWLFVTQASDPVLTLWLLVGCIAVLFIGNSFAGVAWFDILGRVLSPRARGRSIATGSFIGLIAGIGSGLIVQRVLSPTGLGFPTNYAIIFLCAWACFLPSVIALISIKETPMSATEHSQTMKSPFLHDLMVAVRKDRMMQRLILARVFTGMETLAAAFYVVYIRERLGLNDGVLGVFSIASVGGGLIGTLFSGWLNGRRGSRGVIRFAVVLQVIAPMLALIVAAIPVISTAAPEVALAFFVVIIGINGAVAQASMLGFQGYPLDVAPERQRAMYLGVVNSISGIVTLTPLLGGILLEELTHAVSSGFAYSVIFAIAAMSVLTGLAVSFRLPKVQRS